MVIAQKDTNHDKYLEYKTLFIEVQKENEDREELELAKIQAEREK